MNINLFVTKNFSFVKRRAGKLRITFAMGLTSYLDQESSYFPWVSFLGSLGYVGSALSRTLAYGDFEVD